jgi:hypothetical protein
VHPPRAARLNSRRSLHRILAPTSPSRSAPSTSGASANRRADVAHRDAVRRDRNLMQRYPTRRRTPEAGEGARRHPHLGPQLESRIAQLTAERKPLEDEKEFTKVKPCRRAQAGARQQRGSLERRSLWCRTSRRRSADQRLLRRRAGAPERLWPCERGSLGPLPQRGKLRGATNVAAERTSGLQVQGSDAVKSPWQPGSGRPRHPASRAAARSPGRIALPRLAFMPGRRGRDACLLAGAEPSTDLACRDHRVDDALELAGVRIWRRPRASMTASTLSPRPARGHRKTWRAAAFGDRPYGDARRPGQRASRQASESVVTPGRSAAASRSRPSTPCGDQLVWPLARAADSK